MVKDADGVEIKVGETVGFKRSVEMTGKVKKVWSSGVVIEYNDSVTDEKKTITVLPSRCWHEG